MKPIAFQIFEVSPQESLLSFVFGQQQQTELELVELERVLVEQPEVLVEL